jgi:hypothetical protein
VPATTRLKNALLAIADRLSGRHAVLLPGEAGSDGILDVEAPYRVENARLELAIRDREGGRARLEILDYVGHFPTKIRFHSDERATSAPARVTLDLTTGALALDGNPWGTVPLPLASRRFCVRLTVDGGDGKRRTRTTGHYLPSDAKAIGADYYQGGNYVDYEAESAGEGPRLLKLFERHRVRGPVLEAGCATGALLRALDEKQIPSVGLDLSDYAVAEVRRRLGSDRAYACDVERGPIPDEVRARGPFGALILWSLFEHFSQPFSTLARLSELVAPGGHLLISTTNSDSLTHFLFGAQWEGHFDGTHAGVEKVGARSLRSELPKIGFQVVELRTEQVWDRSADPTRATLRDWFAGDARFRRLLLEQERGDILTCVALKR